MKQLIIICTVYCVLSSANCIAQSISVLRGPYLQVGTPNSMIVRWRTDSVTPVNSRVWYGALPDTAGMAFVDSASLTTEHEVNITGLSPNTKYFYAIGTSDTILAGPDSMHYFQTSPVPGTKQPIRVWAIGDFGEGNANQAAVRDAYKNFSQNKHTDVWLWLGDNAYDSGLDSEYQTNVFEMYPEIFNNTVVWPSPGNHDYGSTHPVISDASAYFNNFTMPVNGEAGGAPSGNESYFSYDYGNVHFISLNSEDYTYSNLNLLPPCCSADITHNPDMITWLQNDLAANVNKDWIIAYWHATPYSEGTHSENYPCGADCFRRIEGAVMRSMRDYIVPILENYGVDLIICGHSHNYERSFLVHGFYGTDSIYPADSILVDGSSGSIGPYIKYSIGPNPNLGTVYAVVGSSAKTGSYTDPDDGDLTHPLMYTGDYILGSMLLEINGNQLDAYFIDTATTAFDNFTILKDPTGINDQLASGENNYKLKIYPNPFSNNINVDINTSGVQKLTVLNLLGENVFEINGKHNTALKQGTYSLSTGHLEKGIYFLRADRTNDSAIFKIINIH